MRRLILSGLSLVVGLALAPASALAGLHLGASTALHRQNPAATGTVLGRVTQQTSGAGIPGVTVTIVGTRLGAATDDSGRYRITGVATGQQSVNVRRIGFVPVTLPVTVAQNAEATVNVELIATATRLSEIVTTATGEQRKVEIGSAIATVSVDSLLASAAVTNFTELVGGRVSGIQVLQNSGVTGSSPRIRIRGFNSLTVSNNPILIIDGVRVEGSAGASGGLGWTAGRMTDFNVDDFESLEIVKGPSAATLYGTDAANGVIVIKTKKGQVGRTTYNVHAERGIITQPSRFIDDYFAFGKSTATGAPLRCTNLLRGAGGCTLDSVVKWNPMRDSKASPVGTGERQQLGMQVSGGVERFRYYLSGEQEDETGYLKLSDSEIARVTALRNGQRPPSDQIHPNYLQKLNLRSNIASTLSPQADVSLSTGVLFQKSQVPAPTVFSNAAYGPGFNDANEGWAGGLRPGEIFATRSAENVARFTGSATANWLPIHWLSTHGTVGVDLSNNFNDNLQKRGETSPTSTGQRQNIRTGITLTSVDLGSSAFFTVLPGVTSKSSVGVQYNKRQQLTTIATGTNLPPGSSTVAGAATLSSSESTVESVVAGAYAEQVLSLNDRLFFSAAVRADGASSFGTNFKTAVYPKASLSWLISEEPFFRPIAKLTSVRYRLAYGSSGVQPAATASLPLLDLVTVFTGGTTQSGSRLNSIGNPNLKPERQREIETGLDLEFLEGRVHLEGTYYDRLSHDALINRAIPTSFGLAGTGRLENLGSVSNRGWEGLLNARILNWSQLRFDLTVSGSVNRNRLEKLPPDLRPPEDRFIRFVQGYPLFGQWDRPRRGFHDDNGDGIIETSEAKFSDSVVYLGNPNPTHLLTVTPLLRLLNGRLTISSLFDYKGGWIQTNFTEDNKCNAAVCRAVNDPTTPLAEQAGAVTHLNPLAGATYEPYVQNGTFTRWREAAVTWDLGSRVASHLRATSATLSLSARNLHIWTGYNGLDPEVTQQPSLSGNFGTVWDLGYDNPVSPQSRYWILKMNLGF